MLFVSVSSCCACVLIPTGCFLYRSEAFLLYGRSATLSISARQLPLWLLPLLFCSFVASEELLLLSYIFLRGLLSGLPASQVKYILLRTRARPSLRIVDYRYACDNIWVRLSAWFVAPSAASSWGLASSLASGVQVAAGLVVGGADFLFTTAVLAALSLENEVLGAQPM